MVTPDMIRLAAARIAGSVRRTPLFRPAPAEGLPQGGLCFKLECLQASGAFKVRGALAKLATLDEAALSRGIITASGGNHGLAVAWAGRRAGAQVTVCLPESAPADKVAGIEALGARPRVGGATWDDANEAALAIAEREGRAYVHPFSDPWVIAGQGTVGLEVMEECPDIDLVIASVGGGGLIAGVATWVKAARPAARVIGVEPVGAPTLSESLREGSLVTLPRITTAAGSLAPRRSAQLNLDIIRHLVDDLVLVSDDEMRAAARWLWRECHLGVELSGAAALAALFSGRIAPRPGAKVCAIICGAGTDGMG